MAAFLVDDLGGELNSLRANGNQVSPDATATGRSAMAGGTAAIDQLAVPADKSVVIVRIYAAWRSSSAKDYVFIDVLFAFRAASHADPAVMVRRIWQFGLGSICHEDGLFKGEEFTAVCDLDANRVSGDGGTGRHPAVFAVNPPARPRSIGGLEWMALGQEISRFLIVDECPAPGQGVSRLDENIDGGMLRGQRGFGENLALDFDRH